MDTVFPGQQDSEASAIDQHEDNTETPEAFYTATPGYGTHNETPGRLNLDTEYGRALNEEKLLVAKEVESNWSGRGQNVEFNEGDVIPLEVEKTIGYSSTALVESVRCRRIRLARKSIRCNRNANLKDLVLEVSYLHKLRHPHIIQMVGTYFQKNTFAILLYPVATGDLPKFLDEWRPTEGGTAYGSSGGYALRDIARFFFCLTHALRYMHDQGVRHMDIKPGNILVHERRIPGFRPLRSVYLTDFGISRAFTEEEGSQTKSSLSMTKRWCSPEVAAHERRGRAADIFSMGCVFLSMYTVLTRKSLADFEIFRAQDGISDAFHATLPRVHQWMRQLQTKVESGLTGYTLPKIPPSPGPFLNLLADMVAENPEKRPKSSQIANRMESMTIWWVHGKQLATYEWLDHEWKCCSVPPKPYRVAEEDEIYEAFHFK